MKLSFWNIREVNFMNLNNTKLNLQSMFLKHIFHVKFLKLQEHRPLHSTLPQGNLLYFDYKVSHFDEKWLIIQR